MKAPGSQKTLEKLKLFEAILDRTQDGLLVFNARFEVIYANAVVARMVRQDPSDLRRMDLSHFIPTDQRKNHEKLVDRFSASSQTQQNLLEWRHIQCCRSDGSLFPAQIIIHKYSVLGQKIYIVSLKDMSELRQSEHEKQQVELSFFQAEQLGHCYAQTLDLKFAGAIETISDKINNSVSVTDQENIKSALEGIKTYALQAIEFSHNSSDLSLKQAKALRIPLNGASFFDRLEAICALQAHFAQTKGVKFVWTIHDELRRFHFENMPIIEQIVYNILDDALGNASAGLIKFNLSKLLKDDDGQLYFNFLCSSSRFGVKQNVMNEALLSQSAAPSTAVQNLYKEGMCLRLCKHLIEQDGGYFQVVSHPVEGTRVSGKIIPLSSTSQIAV